MVSQDSQINGFEISTQIRGNKHKYLLWQLPQEDVGPASATAASCKITFPYLHDQFV